MIDPTIFVGESEGQPLLIRFDKSFGQGFADRSRPSAVTIIVLLRQIDGNGLPPQTNWSELEALEAALVKEFAETEDDWRYVVRLYGEGVARFCFYGRKTSSAPARLTRVLAEFPQFESGHRIVIQPDPTWAAYSGYFPTEEGQGEIGGVAPSFRDDDASLPQSSRRPARTSEEQPWRGEESQGHPYAD